MKKKPTKKVNKTVTIEVKEWWSTKDGIVFRHWKFPDGSQHDTPTALNDIPFVEFKLTQNEK